MFPATPPVADLSRVRLRQFSSWIRDELDPMIARDGPEKLRADDVLMLHELFRALRVSPTVTALDLRATGIHRAVLEVAGTATRWPGRLADDCDRIISVWQSKFGRLEDLRPFMYGRGGRLEGIATVGEFSSAVLLKRWQTTCPDQIAPRRSRRHGDLGFRAGDWWMNPLYAHYAGIIDLKSSEGGICFDKHGTYAIVLKDTGEIEASESSRFTYRCAQGDNGKFRLTSATENSRRPVRVLRCHSLNSLWGPKAGARYEGLHRVLGWTIRTAKSDDGVGKEYKAGDIIYEVRLERIDPVPMEEVLKRPTASELDDYAEYKRLRRVHRDEHRQGVLMSSGSHEFQVSTKVAPPIPPTNAIISQLRTSTQASPNSSHTPTTTFKDPVATIVNLNRLRTNPTSPSPLTTKSSTNFTIATTTELEPPLSLCLPKSTFDPLALPMSSPNPQSSTSGSPLASASLHVQQRGPALLSSHSGSGEGSHLSGGGSHHSYPSDIRKVVPWIDYDLEPVVASPSIAPRLAREQRVDAMKALTGSKTRNQSTSSSDIGGSNSNPVKSLTPLEKAQLKKKNIEGKKQRPTLLGSKRKDNKKSAHDTLRSKNPLAKLFDGADSTGDDTNNYSSTKDARHASFSAHPSLPIAERRVRVSSSNESIRPLSPIPDRPFNPLSALLTSRRAAISFPYASTAIKVGNMVDLPSMESVDRDDPVYGQMKRPTRSLQQPMTPQSLISVARTLSPINVSLQVPIFVPNRISSTSKATSSKQLKEVGTVFQTMSSKGMDKLVPEGAPQDAL